MTDPPVIERAQRAEILSFGVSSRSFVACSTTESRSRCRTTTPVDNRSRCTPAAGCELAVSTAVPGGASERNLLRLGFALVYTKLGLSRPI